MRTRTLVFVVGLSMILVSPAVTILIPRSRIDSSRDENKLISTSSSAYSSPSFSISASYACLEIPSDLPPCDFETIENDVEEPSNDPIGGNVANSDSTFNTVYRKKLWSKVGNRMDTRLRIVSENIENNLKNEIEKDSEKTAIIYKLEGCLPSRLPFELPFCKDEESSGKTVVIHRLFPFTVPAISTSKSASKDTLVFPEIDFARWLRLMSRLRDRRDSSVTNDRSNSAEDPEEVTSKSHYRSLYNGRPLMPTENYVDGYSFFDVLRYIVPKNELTMQKKKKVPKTDSSSRRTNPDEECEVLVEFQLHDEDLTGMYYDVTDNSKSSDGKVKEETNANRRNDEFVENTKYINSWKGGSKVLQKAPIKIEIPYSLENPRKLKLTKIDSEFSHEESIPHDVEEQRNLERKIEFVNEKTIPHDPRMVKLPVESSEVLQSRSMSWDRPSKWRYPSKSLQF